MEEMDFSLMGKKMLKQLSSRNCDNNGSAFSSFAQRQMALMGWTKGKGLGKNETGITQYVKVDKKEDNAGIGIEKGEDFENQWWFNVFNKTASKVVVKLSKGSKKSKKDKKKQKRKTKESKKKGLESSTATKHKAGEESGSEGTTDGSLSSGSDVDDKQVVYKKSKKRARKESSDTGDESGRATPSSKRSKKEKKSKSEKKRRNKGTEDDKDERSMQKKIKPNLTPTFEDLFRATGGRLIGRRAYANSTGKFKRDEQQVQNYLRQSKVSESGGKPAGEKNQNDPASADGGKQDKTKTKGSATKLSNVGDKGEKYNKNRITLSVPSTKREREESAETANEKPRKKTKEKKKKKSKKNKKESD